MKLTTLLIFFWGLVAFSQPKIEIVGGNVYDWGQVKIFESPLKTLVKIKNTGNQPLRIFEVKPQCGCTTAPLDKNILEPGEIATLDINLDLKGNLGPVSKDINIMTNDPVNKNVKLILKADAVTSLDKNPKFFAFNTVKPGTKSEAKITLINYSENDIVIKKIIKSHEDMKLSINTEDVIKAKSSKEVTAFYTPTAVGTHSLSVTLMTNDIDVPRLNISAWCRAEE
jgi:hypothetical protein